MFEASAFIDVFGWARSILKHDVSIVTCGASSHVRSAFGTRVIVDIPLQDANADDFSALALPGGFGREGYYDDGFDERLQSLIRGFNAQRKPIAAVCVGAILLGKSGVLQGRRATTYPLEGRAKLMWLESLGAAVTEEVITRDGNIITSQGPHSAPLAALELFAALTSRDAAAELGSLMGWR